MAARHRVEEQSLRHLMTEKIASHLAQLSSRKILIFHDWKQSSVNSKEAGKTCDTGAEGAGGGQYAGVPSWGT